MKIRRMEEKDLECVSRIEEETFSMPWSRDAFLEMINNKDAYYYVAEENGEIAGSCGVRDIAGEGEITNVVVREICRGRKIAQKMLAVLLEEGKKAGMQAFTLEVRVSNEEAIHVYEKLGFKGEGVRPDFYAKPREDALIMWKR